MEENPRTPRRRWFQFSLRTLFILTTLAAILFASLSWWSYKARQQREAVASLRAAGAIVMYDFQLAQRPPVKVLRPPHRPAWLVDKLGVDYFANVVCVGISSQAPHADFALLQTLPTLTEIELNGSRVTDDDLVYLAGLSELVQLDLSSTAVTGTGLVHLRGLTQLKRLS
ncbi:MAG: hypothetical protein K8T25_11815 [Planctomycetia bacterium]|nr:hypothetical protein [Planctomycetia bacterium]